MAKGYLAQAGRIHRADRVVAGVDIRLDVRWVKHASGTGVAAQEPPGGGVVEAGAEILQPVRVGLLPGELRLAAQAAALAGHRAEDVVGVALLQGARTVHYGERRAQTAHGGDWESLMLCRRSRARCARTSRRCTTSDVSMPAAASMGPSS